MALVGEIIMQKLYAVKLCAGGIFGSDTEYLFLESEPNEIEFRARNLAYDYWVDIGMLSQYEEEYYDLDDFERMEEISEREAEDIHFSYVEVTDTLKEPSTYF